MCHMGCFHLIGFKNLCLHESNPWGMWISIIHPLALPACLSCSSLNNTACMFMLLFLQHNDIVTLHLHQWFTRWNMAHYLNSLQGNLGMLFLSWHFLIPRWVEHLSKFSHSFPDISWSPGSQYNPHATHPPSLSLSYQLTPLFLLFSIQFQYLQHFCTCTIPGNFQSVEQALMGMHNHMHAFHIPHVGVFQGDFNGKKRVDIFWLLMRGKEEQRWCGRGNMDRSQAYQIQHDFTK